MGDIVVDTEALKDSADKMHQKIVDERANLIYLRNIMISLHEHWKGPSHDALIERYYSQIDAPLPQYLDKIEEAILEMRKTADAFETIEKNCCSKLEAANE